MVADIQFNVDQALAKLGDLVAKHGPEAVNLASRVTQASAIGALVQGVVYGLLAAGVGYGAWRVSALLRGELGKEFLDQNFGAMLFGGLGSLLLFVVAFATAASAASALLDPWTWIAMFDPKLALAHAVLSRVVTP